jgi:hypothetical protein
VSGEDAARGDANGGDAGGGGVTGDEAAWRELVARFSMPADPAEAPWPESENLPGNPAADNSPGDGRGAEQTGDGGPEQTGDRGLEQTGDRGPEQTGDRGPEQTGDRGPEVVAERGAALAREADAGPDRGRGAEPDDAHDTSPLDPVREAGADRTRVIRPATSAASPSPVPATPAVPEPARSLDDEDDEHFVPPPPPPLPHLDPVAKGAWTALFGGPAYLLFTTLMGWTVPGWAALLAVMAFVGGFATVVLRLGDGPSRGSGPDSGAVL